MSREGGCIRRERGGTQSLWRPRRGWGELPKKIRRGPPGFKEKRRLNQRKNPPPPHPVQPNFVRGKKKKNFVGEKKKKKTLKGRSKGKAAAGGGCTSAVSVCAIKSDLRLRQRRNVGRKPRPRPGKVSKKGVGLLAGGLPRQGKADQRRPAPGGKKRGGK